MERQSRSWPAATAVIVLALLTCWPLLGRNWFRSHDTDAYPIRLLEYLQGWRGGTWYPRWCPDLYGGFGSPLFNFYPPGLFVVAGLISVLGSAPIVALKVTIVLFAVAGALGAFGLIRGETGRDDAALLGALTFAYMPYRFTQLAMRGDLAEFAAIALVPIALWAYRAIGRRDGSGRTLAGCAAAASHGATLMTHALTGLWLTQILVVVEGVSALRLWREGRLESLRVLVFSFMAALGLAAIFTVPALMERPLVQTERMTLGSFATTMNLLPINAFLIIGPLNLGCIIPSAILLATAMIVLRRRAPQMRALAGWTLLEATLVLLLLPASAPFWTIVPFGRYIQFPWRLLGFIAVFGAIVAGKLWSVVTPSAGRSRWIAAVALAALVVFDGVHGSPSFKSMNARDLPETAAQIAGAVRSTGIHDEYLPRPQARAPVEPAHQPAIARTQGVIITSAQRDGSTFRLWVSVREPGSIEVQSFWFPGWHVTALGGPAPVVAHPSTQGMISVDFVQPGVYDVVVSFGSTLLRGASAAVSLLTLAGLLCVAGRAACGHGRHHDRHSMG